MPFLHVPGSMSPKGRCAGGGLNERGQVFKGKFQQQFILLWRGDSDSGCILARAPLSRAGRLPGASKAQWPRDPMGSLWGTLGTIGGRAWGGGLIANYAFIHTF